MERTTALKSSLNIQRLLVHKNVRGAYLCLVGQLFNLKSGKLLNFLSEEREKKIGVLDYILCVILYDRYIKLALIRLLEFCLHTVNFTWLFHLQVAWNHFMYISWAPKSQKSPRSNVRSQPIHSEADAGSWWGNKLSAFMFWVKNINSKPPNFLLSEEIVLVRSEQV